LSSFVAFKTFQILQGSVVATHLGSLVIITNLLLNLTVK